MPDLLKEHKEDLVEGIRRLITEREILKRYVRGPVPFDDPTVKHRTKPVDDLRATTGFDGASTSAAFVTDLSAVDGEDVWSF